MPFPASDDLVLWCLVLNLASGSLVFLCPVLNLASGRLVFWSLVLNLASGRLVLWCLVPNLASGRLGILMLTMSVSFCNGLSNSFFILQLRFFVAGTCLHLITLLLENKYDCPMGPKS